MRLGREAARRASVSHPFPTAATLLAPALGLLALSLAACHSSGSGSPASANAKVVAVYDLRQFAGVYRNRSTVDPARPQRKSASLYAYLTGQRRQFGGSAQDEVELRPAADGKSLVVRRLGPGRRVLAEQTLSRPAHFSLGPNGLELHLPSDRTKGTTGNLGAGFTSRKRRLQPTADGLAGQVSRSSVGLLFYVVPMSSSSEQIFLWRRAR